MHSPSATAREGGNLGVSKAERLPRAPSPWPDDLGERGLSQAEILFPLSTPFTYWPCLGIKFYKWIGLVHSLPICKYKALETMFLC